MVESSGWRDAGRQALALAPNLLKLYARLVRDPRVPLRARLLALATLGYTVSPVDLVPDIIPLLGQVDDIVIVASGLRRLAEAAGPEIMAEHWGGDEPVLDSVQAVVDAAAGLAPRPLRRLLEWAAPLS